MNYWLQTFVMCCMLTFNETHFSANTVIILNEAREFSWIHFHRKKPLNLSFWCSKMSFKGLQVTFIQQVHVKWLISYCNKIHFVHLNSVQRILTNEFLILSSKTFIRNVSWAPNENDLWRVKWHWRFSFAIKGINDIFKMY